MKDKETISLKSIIIKYLLQWRIFLIAFVISLIPAILYLIYYPQTYNFTTRIILQDKSDATGLNMSLGGSAGIMKSFGFGGGGSGGILIDDEMAILKSYELLSDVAVETGLNATYIVPFTWLYKQYAETPLIMRADSATLKKQSYGIKFSVKVHSPENITITGKTKTHKEKYKLSSLPATVNFRDNVFILDYGPGYKEGDKVRLDITMRPPGHVAEDIAEDLTVDSYSNSSDMVEIFYTDYEDERGRDLLNSLVRQYNLRADTIRSKELAIESAYYASRLEEVVANLIKTELQIEEYKKQNKMTDIAYDMVFFTEQMKELQTRIIEGETKAFTIELMKKYIENPENKYSILPISVGIEDGGESNSIISYQDAVLERERLLLTTNHSNPLVKTVEKQLDKLRESAKVSIQNSLESIHAVLKDLKGKEKELLNKVQSVPSFEREYIDLKRQQEIYQGIYLVLIQKQEESKVQQLKVAERGLVVDKAFRSALPIGPRKLYAAIGMFLFTLIVPVGYLFVREQYQELKKEYKRTKQ